MVADRARHGGPRYVVLSPHRYRELKVYTGLVGYHPPYPNQPEDEMSTTAVQGGLQTKDPVGVRGA